MAVVILTDYTIHMIRVEPSIDYDAIEKDEYGTSFCLIRYDTKMAVEMKKKPDPKDITAKEDYFKKLFSTESIGYNQVNNYFDVKKRIEVVAIADEATRHQWTFVDPTTPGVYDILPESVRMALNPEKDPEKIPDGNASKADAKSASETPQSKAKKAEQEKLKSAQKKS